MLLGLLNLCDDSIFSIDECMSKDYYTALSNDGFFHFQEYRSFRIGSDGNLQGVGLFISVEPKTGHLVSAKVQYFSSFLSPVLD